MNVIGCDPGGSGAFFELVYDPATGWTPGSSLHMPMVDVGKRIKDVDVRAVLNWLAGLRTPSLMAIEDVGWMPGGEGKSGFAGGGFSSSILTARVNQLIGMVKTLGNIPYETPKPTQWQKAIGVQVPSIKGEKKDKRKKRIKAAVIALVRRRFPTAQLVPAGCRVEDDGLADALALALWATTKLTIPTGR